jgi:hypothetical protein
MNHLQIGELKAAASKESVRVSDETTCMFTSTGAGSSKPCCVPMHLSCKDKHDANLAYKVDLNKEELFAQFGFERYSHLFVTVEIANYVENRLAMAVALKDCKSTRQAAALLFLYLKTHNPNSVINVVRDYLFTSGIFSEPEWISQDLLVENGTIYPMAPQSGVEDWMSLLSRVKTNWSLVVKAPAFTKLSKLLSMCSTGSLRPIAI